ncbi:MAG TPA: hypothetical protein VNA04_18625 [Thermoanaerobaculia bacterium]|nr:hypothetical protein [Thermoanaerobaculia bacterium]
MDVQELRAAERFTAIEPLTATFAGIAIAIVNLSTIGAQIEHPAPIRLGSVARFAIRRGEVAVDVQGFLIWSRLSKTPDADGNHLYRSGVRIESGNRDYAFALHQLIKGGAMRRETDTLENKRRRLLERMAEKNRPGIRIVSDGPEVPQDQLLLVQHARERLLADPEEAQKWYHRAKYAVTHGATNIEIESIRNREEVLAVWEYLERSLDIPTIARAFEKMRSTSATKIQ